MLTVAKKGKKNIFAGTILEIEGIDDLTVGEAFELSDSSAERNAAACALALPVERVVDNVKDNMKVLERLVIEVRNEVIHIGRPEPKKGGYRYGIPPFFHIC